MSIVDYKYKPDKHKCQTGIRTIDEMHKEMMNDFKKNHDLLPTKKKALVQLKTFLENLNNEQIDGPINLDTDRTTKKKILKDKLLKLQREINEIENYKKEMTYFGKTGDVVYDYYHITGSMLYNNNFNKKDVEIEDDEREKEKSKIKISSELLHITQSNNMNRKVKKPVKKRKKEEKKPQRSIMNFLIGEEESHEEDQDRLSKAKLENEYMMMIDKDYACGKSKYDLIKKCKDCGIDKLIVYSESMLCCPKCADAEPIQIETDTPSHKDNFNEKPKYPYKRIGHCIEKLNQFQSKGTTNIPDEVFMILDDEIKKHGIDVSDITMNFLEKMLKKHKLSSHYENIMYIYCQITNTQPMTLTRSEIDMVLNMFVKAEISYYSKYKPDDRDNFLKYSFTLHKIFMTIGKPEHAKYFKLLKSPWKMKQQENIWKDMCDDHGWKYHPS